MQDPEQTVAWFEVGWQGALVIAVVSAAAAHFWGRYLNRMATFRWSAHHLPIALAADTPKFGKIDVTWNGEAVKNVTLCSIEVENESSRDFENVNVKFVYSEGSRFLGYEGHLTGVSQRLPWTTHFQEVAQRFVTAGQEATDADHQYLETNRELVVPVFNRGAKFEITFLMHPPPSGYPYISVYCDHAGVRTVERPRQELFLGVPRYYAERWGLVAGVLLVVLIGRYVPVWWAALGLSFVAGAAVSTAGAGVIHAWRLLKKAIG